MRTLTLLLLTLSLTATAQGPANERGINSRITGAKVFLAGAQVTRSAAAPVKTGSSTLVFTGISQDLDPQSIQVSAKGGFAILSVNHRINYLTESPKKKEIEELQTRVKKLEKEHAFEKAMQDVWVNEEQLLGKNSNIGGQQNGLTAAQLTAVNDYVRERLKVTKSNWLAQQEKLVAINEELGRLRQQLQQLQAQAPRPTSEVVVEIESTAEVQASFTLIYFVPSAGWTPAYDLRAKSVGQPIELLMKAQVINNSGEDWEKVELAFSSGNPTLGGVMPQLRPWVLNQPVQLESVTIMSGGRAKAVQAPVAAGAERSMEYRDDMDATTTMANTVVYRTTTVEFALETPFSVPADGVQHTVGVRTHNVPALYKHFCTPKLEKDAFLYARTTGWEDLNLLPGQANVFFEGTFVGRSFLDLSRPQDTLDISLGRDKGVVVDRVKRKGFSDKPIIGGKRTVTIGWDLTVRNTKGTTVDLEVRDQYPVSPRSEVEVKLTEAGGARVDEAKGQLTWTLKLEPKATQKIGFTYQVKHPKDEPVILE
ncbi:MAG: DUF4139 domain-containing protein [Flavobacteriales bacterium]|nr:DUF4139 domain-containing protein [Flavobacteriales bacterium]